MKMRSKRYADELIIKEIVYCRRDGADIPLEKCRNCRLHRFDGRGRIYCNYKSKE